MAGVGLVVTRCRCVALLLLMTACATPVNKVPTPVALPHSFSVSGTLKAPDKWWQVFQDEALNELLSTALGHNFSLHAAFDRLAQARAIAKKTGADFIPQLNGSSGISHTASDKPSQDSFSFGVAASYELDVWGRIRTGINAARLDVNAAQEEVDSAAISLSAELASNWYKLIEQRQQLALLERQIAVNRKNVALLQVRFSGAQAAAADVLQQQQLLESVIGNQLTVIATISVLENQLAILTGNSPGLIALPEHSEFPLLPPLPHTGLSADVIQRRPDVRRAYLRVQAADQRIASAIADRYPKLSLSASLGANSPSLEALFTNWLGTIAGNLLVPMIDGGRRVAEVERNQALAAEAMNTYATTLLTAVKEVENALIQERQQQQLVINLQKQVELATQSSERLRVRYLYGAMDFLRVLSAQLSQQSLERTLIQARQQLIDYRINLYRALAGGFSLTDSIATAKKI
ncbi:efflux transporter outer membrane subunit [Crenothrix polyspora]|uniref:Putative outer membrane efflux protein (OprM-family protein) n=1 Tax=Crenothrix polyspora TaxID=360316 RepID=A0A1R4GYQ2_9GAMM|nr:efflux transporter outer membrane subunit [Crenothrix polyspora]SJM89092.1 putative outer membrane efflux protein (OprM-family protein) [Crenothrix polyspora]